MKRFSRRKKLPDGTYVEEEYFVYTKEEADGRGIRYVPWREVKREGEFVIDDHGYVYAAVGVYEVEGYKGKMKKMIQFPFDRRWVSKKLWGYLSPRQTWQQREAAKTRTKRFVKAYVRMRLEKGRPLTTQEHDYLGRVWRNDPSNRIPAASSRRLLKVNEVQDMVAEELLGILRAEGVTARDVVQNYEDLRSRAIESGNLHVAKAILDKYAEMLDMKPDKVSISAGREVTQVNWSGVLSQPYNEEEEGWEPGHMKLNSHVEQQKKG